jgi:hypothetical protein
VNALERLMGLVLVMLATQMFLDGIRLWMKGKAKSKTAAGKKQNGNLSCRFWCLLPLPVGEVRASTAPKQGNQLPFWCLLPLPVGEGRGEGIRPHLLQS